ARSPPPSASSSTPSSGPRGCGSWCADACRSADAGCRMNRIVSRRFVIAAVLSCSAIRAHAQQPTQSAPQSGQQGAPQSQQETLDDTIEAGDEELATPARNLVKWNEYDGDFFHFRIGGGFLYEGVAYSQNAAST